ncbi:MurR/RpiR family transcriptional regulator [Aquibaculum arenosum]|uniref:MurR/RpiR family transcriptional regulator n=1 Tax=Aquibaculum arenosum TaxID=3032591 RepID=A0ABT5YT52_9PROT|nr:MurR/RpiR family transcriptional regulator [Fodinicurvata sp. CAU 1616]MDF2097389.1 MurR/RpiR family transcriptional regulator [Fodinicurvata sp. CAU 1616]
MSTTEEQLNGPLPENGQGEAYGKPIPDILSLIKDSYGELRPAERRVADAVLADVTFSVGASNAEIARRADVSEPTVTRFCRAIGCDGVRDFKLKLAQSVVVGRLYLTPMAPGEPGEDGSPLWNVVFQEVRNALSAVEHSVDPRAVLKAADMIARAGKVLVFGLGGSSSFLALETENRLFRYGITVAAHSDPYVMKMTASTLKRNDLVIAISGTGRTREVVEAVALAKHYRAGALAITAPNTDLASTADVALTVDIPEYPDPLKPTASRYAFLAIIDLVSTAVGYRLDPHARETLRRIKYTVLNHRQGKVLEPLGD